MSDYWHFSLTILRFVTRMSPASADSFFLCSSASPFSFAADSGAKVPITRAHGTHLTPIKYVFLAFTHCAARKRMLA